MMAEIRIEHVPLSELREMFAPNNPKEHDVGAIVESVRRFGFASPVVLDDGTHQLAEGHGRIEALARMKASGEPPPERIEDMADGDWSVPVVRGIRFASEQEADAYRIAANQTTILGGWDDVKLIEVLRELSEFDGGLRGTGYGEEDLAALEIQLAQVNPKGLLTDEDDIPDEQEETITQPGDLWLMGEHRLLCGDATNAEDVERLLNGQTPNLCVTDPPYGASIVKGGTVGGGGMTAFGQAGKNTWVKARKYVSVTGDENTDAARKFYEGARDKCKQWIIWGGHHFTMFLPPSRCWLVWDKENNGDFGDCELAWTSFDRSIRLYRHLWNGLSRTGSHALEGKARVHPTQKPVTLHINILSDFSDEADLIFDGFLGSGTTLIAAEKLNRRCYAVEIEPRYVDVAVRRWMNATGKAAIRESDGFEFPQDYEK